MSFTKTEAPFDASCFVAEASNAGSVARPTRRKSYGKVDLGKEESW